MYKEQEIGLAIHPATQIQLKYLLDRKHRFIVVTAGRRSRKTLIGSLKLLLEAMTYSNQNYFYAAPTFMQSKGIFWEKMLARAKFLGIVQDIKISDLVLRLTNGSQITVTGLDKPERIEGRPWHGCHITEFGNLKAGAWPENIRPVLSDTNGFAIIDGVPEGMNHYYDVVMYACDNIIPKTLPSVGAYCESKIDPQWAYYSWHSSDVLTPDEIKAAMREMDERTFRQEYEGTFEKSGGVAYYTFNENNVVNYAYSNQAETYLCWDFNVGDSPMAAILVQKHPHTKDTYSAVKEFVFNDSNTEEVCQAITDFFVHNPLRGNLTVLGDYAGRRRESSASFTDYQIIEHYFKNFNGYTVKTRPTRAVKDRVASLNTLFRSAAGVTRMYVSPECKKLIEDLRRVVWKDAGTKLDQTNPARTHASDALSYFAYNIHPMDLKEITYTTRG